MNATALVARNMALALVLGGLLGLLYGFLRPLRHRHRHWADLFFIVGTFYAWLYLSFAICRGDLRLSYTLCFLGGCILFDRTLGQCLLPLFAGFWKFWGGIGRFLLVPFKKNI